jgi:hypothetical protein
MLTIEEVRYLGDFTFSIRFSDGRTGTVDIRSLTREEPKGVFVRRFKLEYGTLCWPGDLDVAPEYIYFLAFRGDPELHDQFVKWGYLEQPAHA